MKEGKPKHAYSSPYNNGIERKEFRFEIEQPSPDISPDVIIEHENEFEMLFMETLELRPNSIKQS